MIRFISAKVLILLLYTNLLSAEKIPDLFNFIDINGQEFLTVIKEEGSNYADSPEEFKEKLKNIWEPMVDIRVVSRLILSKDIHSNATDEQIVTFEERTKKVLLDKYVTTLIEFGNYNIETIEDIKVTKRTYEVSMKFYSASDSFITKFTVYKDSNGDYKIVNIIIDGINLGLTFRNSFQDTYIQYNKDLDKAIEAWRPTTF